LLANTSISGAPTAGSPTTQTVVTSYVGCINTKTIADTTEGSIAFVRDFARRNTNNKSINYDSSEE